MAKARESATETLVETAQDLDFAEPEGEPAPRSEAVGPRGESVQDQIEAIRATRAKQRLLRGNAGKRRVITHYHDAERLQNLGMLSPEEVVDCEEAGLLPDPAHFYDSSGGTRPEGA